MNIPEQTPKQRIDYVERELVSLRVSYRGSRMNLFLLNNDAKMGRVVPVGARQRTRDYIRSIAEQIAQLEDELVLLYGE